MEQFKIFKSPNFGEIKTITVDGNFYFIAEDVVLALGYTKVNKAIHKHVDKSDVTKLCVTKVVVDSGIKVEDSETMAFLLINENGVNALVSASAHPDAKKFKEWVTSEIIPSINETKADRLKAELKECLEMLPLAQHLLKIHQNFIENVEERIAELKSKIESETGESKSGPQDDTDKSRNTINLASNLNKLPEHLKIVLQTIGIIKQVDGEWILTDKVTKCSCPKCSGSETIVN